MPTNPNRRRCSATTRSGAPCRAWAMRDSDPPLCATHGQKTKGAGAPLHNTNRLRHGIYATVATQGALAALVGLADDDCQPSATLITTSLMTQFKRVEALIDWTLLHLDAAYSLDDVIKLFTLHAATASRLGRLLQLPPGHPPHTDVPWADTDTPLDLLQKQMMIGARLLELTGGVLPEDAADFTDPDSPFYDPTTTDE